MASSISTKPTSTCFLALFHNHPHHLRRPLAVSLPLSPPLRRRRRRPLLCFAAKSPTGPLEKKPNKKRKKKPKSDPLSFSDVEIVESSGDAVDLDVNVNGPSPSSPLSPSSESRSLGYYSTPLPKPPAGFVVDDHGRVLMASDKRIATIVDPTNNFPLECVIRRVFRSSRGDECMLLCPVDTPVQMLKSTNIEGWSAVGDEEVEAILPAAAYVLAKIHMHLVHNDGQDVDGLPTEGVEITCFHLDGAHYMIYTPSDPLLFVAVKVIFLVSSLSDIYNSTFDNNGLLQIADDDLLEDSAIISAIDEETEFNALVEEEAALLDSLLGKE
ncbi:hypothetical protein TIFTF001_001994 [Ficus carica]|uniref:Uncharacterized protein n=1 Tax=Ficus carica TaxID=3494 RepID=A0AA87ZJV5_FICCA|nr:hypothetical protein TIFTF001_001994 [Ficus carica]